MNDYPKMVGTRYSGVSVWSVYGRLCGRWSVGRLSGRWSAGRLSGRWSAGRQRMYSTL